MIKNSYTKSCVVMSKRGYVEIIWRLPIGDQVNEIREYKGDDELDEYIAETTDKYNWVLDEVFMK
jgi:hypothetical protein